jgi:hypothetical protein
MLCNMLYNVLLHIKIYSMLHNILCSRLCCIVYETYHAGRKRSTTTLDESVPQLNIITKTGPGHSSVEGWTAGSSSMGVICPGQSLWPASHIGCRWCSHSRVGQIRAPHCTSFTSLAALDSELSRKLAEWLAENIQEELVIPEKQGAQYIVPQLNSILANNLMPNRVGGILGRSRLYNGRGRPKASCYPFDLDAHRFIGQNPQVFIYHVT